MPSEKAAPGGGTLALIGPWQVSRPYFGLAAVGLTEIAPSTPREKYNILAVGLFCGSRQSKAHPINLYVYGLDAFRLASSLPVEATFTLDGHATNLVLRPYNDIASGTVSVAFVRSLMMARDATVSIKDYRSPDPDRIKMDGAADAIRVALRGCFTEAATPFRCQGPFGRDANHAKLVATFGADNVASEYDGLYDAEVTIIYPNDPKRRLKLLWKDQQTHRGLRTVHIAGPSSWIVAGVTVGMPLVELERLNRGPFRLTDFDGDFPGAIYDWMGGRLHAPLPGGCIFGASVMIKKGNVLDLEAAREAARDGSWLSSNESLRAAKPVVSEISVGFE